MTNEEKTEHIIRRLSNTIETNRAVLKEFADSFVEDPTYRFEWADSDFKRAAEIKVFGEVVGALKAKRNDLNGIAEYALERTVNGAKDPPHSTSPCSNLMSQCLTSTWAEIYSMINDANRYQST